MRIMEEDTVPEMPAFLPTFERTEEMLAVPSDELPTVLCEIAPLEEEIPDFNPRPAAATGEVVLIENRRGGRGLALRLAGPWRLAGAWRWGLAGLLAGHLFVFAFVSLGGAQPAPHQADDKGAYGAASDADIPIRQPSAEEGAGWQEGRPPASRNSVPAAGGLVEAALDPQDEPALSQRQAALAVGEAAHLPAAGISDAAASGSRVPAKAAGPGATMAASGPSGSPPPRGQQARGSGQGARAAPTRKAAAVKVAIPRAATALGSLHPSGPSSMREMTPAELMTRIDTAWEAGAIEEVVLLGRSSTDQAAQRFATRADRFAKALEQARASRGVAAAPALEQALGWAEEIGQDSPHVREVRRALAALHRQAARRADAKEDFEGALHHCEQALAVFPRDSEAQSLRAALGARAGAIYLEGYALQHLDPAAALRRVELAERLALPGDPWGAKAKMLAARLRGGIAAMDGAGKVIAGGL